MYEENWQSFCGSLIRLIGSSVSSVYIIYRLDYSAENSILTNFGDLAAPRHLYMLFIIKGVQAISPAFTYKVPSFPITVADQKSENKSPIPSPTAFRYLFFSLQSELGQYGRREVL